MRTFYDTSTLPFRPAVKIKPIGRYWHPDYSTWFVVGRVTTRNDWHGRKTGDIVRTSWNELRAKQGSTRGRLYWSGAMLDSELLALSIVSGESDK